METDQSLPGYKVFEYQIVLNPHEELRSRIIKVREEFRQKFKTDPGLLPKPQMSLVTFSQYEMFEEKISNRLQAVAMGYHPVKIELKDFGSFPTHTIYINIISKVPVQELIREIRSNAQKMMKLDKEHKPHFMTEPHLTIARKLQPWQYEQGWLEYSHRHFSGRFIADSMLLLKRQTGQLKYEVVRRFEFQNLLVGIKQGKLFS